MKKYIASQLPAEYEQVDSVLGGDGTNINNAYLNTRFKCSDFYGCEIEICMLGNLRERNKWYLNGAYEPGKVAQSGLIGNSTTTCYGNLNYGFAQAVYTSDVDVTKFHTLYMSDGEQRFDGVPYAYENYGTLTDYVYLLFARKDSSGVTVSPPMNIKYFWVKKDGDYLLNYIPARRKSDGKIGFYDTVSETFSIGTGNLRSGGDYAGDWVNCGYKIRENGAWEDTDSEKKRSGGSWSSPNTRSLSKGSLLSKKSEIYREYRDVKEPVPDENKDEQIKR